MKQLLALIALATGLNSYCQKEFPLKELPNHVGDTVKVCGKIYSGVFVSTSEAMPTFLNMGGAYPNHLLTIVIWPKERDAMKENPERLTGRVICITGKVELYKGKPQIVLHDPNQLSLPGNEQTPPEKVPRTTKG